MNDYANILKDLDLPESDLLDEEPTQKLKKLRDELILLAHEIAVKRTMQFNNPDVYAMLFTEDSVLQQFFVMVFHNRNITVYGILKQYQEQIEKRYGIEVFDSEGNCKACGEHLGHLRDCPLAIKSD